MTPTRDRIRQLIATLRTTNYDQLEHRLLAALDRNTRSGDATPDGYPTNTLNDSTGSAELTSVESAAHRRLDHPDPDKMRANLRHACRFLDDAVHALHIVDTRLARIETHSARTPPAPEKCQACRIRPAELRSTAGGRLDHAYELCEPCVHFATHVCERHGIPPRIPTPEEAAHHDRTGRWKLRIPA